ncbi:MULTISPECIES: right-handed parallel beta-helix repeat-containing protein [Sphingobacterium]|uniref:right-handed parallel beta-helix repeat-containing protein n=1 Tax=Sphingobacterium TaxID=28453 RepID=UPI00257E1B5A|nr:MULTISPECIES: right-handed parallel beta-helix repeat-containing protein [Sphingobacterium]
MKYIKLLALFLNLFVFLSCIGAESILNVKDFGAVPNDKKDDIKAFQSCINAAVKIKGKVLIRVPAGTYDLSKELTFDFLDGDISFIGEVKNGVKPTLQSTSPTHIIWVKGFLFSPSKGSFTIKNLNIVGFNTPYTPTHPKINKDKWYAALLITDKSRATVDQVSISNFYGQGIHISTTATEPAYRTGAFSSVSISNCRITDVWGFNPKKDDYGDGIYLANVASGNLENNIIANRVRSTKQLGRAGIVLEYMCQNISVKSNSVNMGYDRAIHIENTYGGHKITHNSFKGSDLCMIIAESGKGEYLPVIIDNNTFTNENLPKTNTLIKTYAANSFGDRALIYIITSSNFNTEKFVFQNNNLIVDHNFQYGSNALINNRTKDVRFERNKFEAKVGGKNLSIFNYGKGKLLNNQMIGDLNVKE